MKKTSLIFLLFFTMLSLNTHLSLGQTKQKDGETFGKSFSPKGAIPAKELPAKVTGNEAEKVKVEGTVKEVCQVKGCWIKVDVGNGQEMMVKFKDYGFFVPKTSVGKTVVLNGKAFQETVSVDELRHYAEDEGKSKEEINNITQPKTTLQFEAEGVILKNK